MLTTRAHAADLREQIARLERLLQAEREEKAKLLDRLLERHNFAPMGEAANVRQPAASTLQILSPFGGGTTPEITDAARESWVSEEAAYLEAEHNMTPAQARELAEQRWLSEHRI